VLGARYPLCIDSIKTVCNNFHVILLWLMLPMDHFVSRFVYITTAGVNCCGAIVKLSRNSLQCYYFAGPSGSLMPTLLSVGNWVPLKPVLGVWGMLHLFIIPHVRAESNRTAIFMLFCFDTCFRGITLFPDFFLDRITINWEKINIHTVLMYKYPSTSGVSCLHQGCITCIMCTQ
jgi:hypothetical protein